MDEELEEQKIEEFLDVMRVIASELHALRILLGSNYTDVANMEADEAFKTAYYGD